ncbi:hypothetical protein EVAR_5970_1 [Eumeta japonica]|uniref:Uncharacterized protein n=1 Tax=Eumeta variegata TaxID=151549 RepID=A0A4C1TFG9_EUMVA|nr:hypothetical protein EVAR_5970_1 [Eumeta japonica]
MANETWPPANPSRYPNVHRITISARIMPVMRAASVRCTAEIYESPPAPECGVRGIPAVAAAPRSECTAQKHDPHPVIAMAGASSFVIASSPARGS